MIGAAVPVAAMSILAAIALLFAMVLATSEFALSKLTRAIVEDLIQEEKKHAVALMELVNRRRVVIFVLRGVRTFTQVGFAVSMATIALHLANHWWLAGLVTIVIVTLAQFLANSVIATHWAQRNPTGAALLFTPLITRLVAIAHFFAPVAHKARAVLPQPERTEAEMRAEMADELREMVDQVGETEGFEDEDRQMLRSVFELGHTLVREVMVPRTEMVTISFDTPAHKALRLFVRSGFSRIPVTGTDTDDVRGILFFKDVVQRLQTYEGDHELRADQMMRPAEFTIEMKPADDLFARCRPSTSTSHWSSMNTVGFPASSPLKTSSRKSSANSPTNTIATQSNPKRFPPACGASPLGSRFGNSASCGEWNCTMMTSTLWAVCWPKQSVEFPSPEQLAICSACTWLPKKRAGAAAKLAQSCARMPPKFPPTTPTKARSSNAFSQR